MSTWQKAWRSLVKGRKTCAKFRCGRSQAELCRVGFLGRPPTRHNTDRPTTFVFVIAEAMTVDGSSSDLGRTAHLSSARRLGTPARPSYPRSMHTREDLQAEPFSSRGLGTGFALPQRSHPPPQKTRDRHQTQKPPPTATNRERCERER